MIINMDDIRQERPNESPILKLNKRLKLTSLNKKLKKKFLGAHVKKFIES